MNIPKPNATFVRFAINSVVGLSTYAVTTAVIKNNVSEPETKTQKASLAVGSFVLGNLVAATCNEWVNAKIDDTIGEVKEQRKLAEEKIQDTKS